MNNTCSQTVVLGVGAEKFILVRVLFWRVLFFVSYECRSIVLAEGFGKEYEGFRKRLEKICFKVMNVWYILY